MRKIEAAASIVIVNSFDELSIHVLRGLNPSEFELVQARSDEAFRSHFDVYMKQNIHLNRHEMLTYVFLCLVIIGAISGTGQNFSRIIEHYN